jgi:hypothetical protein
MVAHAPTKRKALGPSLGTQEEVRQKWELGWFLGNARELAW